LNANNSGNTDTNAQGSKLASRTSSAEYLIYKNGALLTTVTDTSITIPSGTKDFTFFAEHRSTSSWVDVSSDQLATGFLGGGLTAAQVADYYSAEQTYLSAVGAV
jgi:hypothetical protein